ncbi:MAG: DNA mismatch repair endonuclease MutL, partial [Oscillospiraceae bacterium]
MPIKILDKSVCELIAAGEVVERPASVVKELVENAIDAHATSIEVELKRNGLDMIRVTDNGSGIPCDEVRTAFLRHATSKISGADDLDGILTLGFRGEALAAICAVSRVKLVSRTENSPSATLYRIEAGEELELDEIGAPCGTSMYISDIFYNTPARMKFLKKDVHEGNAVQSIVEQLALSHPEISFKLFRDGRAAFSSPGNGDLESAAFCVFPREIATNLLKISPVDSRIKVDGLISKPQLGRPSRSLQFVFVNDRFIKSRSICAAAEEACRNLVMAGKHPAFVIDVHLPCEDVDINVHPAKTEVRFKNEREVTANVYSAIKLALNEFAGGFSVKPSVDEEENKSFRGKTDGPVTSAGSQAWGNTASGTAAARRTDSPQSAGDGKSFFKQVSAQEFTSSLSGENDRIIHSVASPYRASCEIDIEVDAPIKLSQLTVPYISKNGAKELSTCEQSENASSVSKNKAEISGDESESKETVEYIEQKAYSEPIIQIDENSPAYGETPLGDQSKQEELFSHKDELNYIGEVFDTYIIAQYKDVVLLIDKHAAHERILFEKLKEDGFGNERQMLIEPIIASVSKDEKQEILDNAELLKRIGFVAEEFGDNELAVREIPTYMSINAVSDAVVQMAAQLVALSGDVTTQDREWLLHSSACRAAIKAGHKSSRLELIKLADDIISSRVPKFCPHGRPVY